MRPIRALLGFMAQPYAVAFQRDACAPIDGDGEAEFNRRWAEAEAITRQLAPLTSFDAGPRPLNAAAQAHADEIAASEVFQLFFGAGSFGFASVDLGVLVGAQQYIDAGHVDGLEVPPEQDEAAVLEFCMKANPIDLPLVGTDGAITFSSHYSQNLVPLKPSFRAVSDHKVEVTASIISRPNFVHLARINDRFIITNGYHRAVALSNAGHTRMPCLLQTMPSLEAAGLAGPAFFDATRIFANRPPLAIDYRTGSGLTSDLQIRARNHVLRVGFQVQGFEAPR